MRGFEVRIIMESNGGEKVTMGMGAMRAEKLGILLALAVVAAFAVTLMVRAPVLGRYSSAGDASSSSPSTLRGLVVRFEELEWKTVSHDRSIKKKVILGSDLIPHLTGFHRSVFKPGQIAPGHSHDDMHEVFYVEAGKGTFVLNGENVAVNAGTTVYLAPHDVHEVKNTGTTDMVLVYFGVTDA